MHGDNDLEVPQMHGKMLFEKAQNAHDPWWVVGGTHNDIDYKFRWDYFKNISKFLKALRDGNLKMSESERESFYKVHDWHKKSKHIYFTKAPKMAEKAQKKMSKNPKLIPDYYAGSFAATNASFLTTGHNITNMTYKHNTESLITAGD